MLIYSSDKLQKDLHHELIKKIALGNEEALTEVYHHFAEKVYNTAISYLKNIEEAEEVTQDVFFEVYKSAKHFKFESSLSTWIYKLTVNKSLDTLRKRKAKKRFGIVFSIFSKPNEESNVGPTDFHHPGASLEQQEDSTILFKAIDQLNHNQKTAFILSQIEGLKHKEIANILDVTPKAVESLIGRSKQKLREILEKDFPNRGKSK